MRHTKLTSRSTAIAAFIATILVSGDLHAQACQGVPAGGFWVERGDLALGNTIGGGAALTGRRLGVAANFRHRDVSEALSGNEAGVRAALVLRASAVQLCPVLSAGVTQDEWQVQNALTLKSTRAAAAAGVGVGVPLRIVGDFSLVPHVIGQYEYSGTYFEFDGGSGEKEESAAVGGRIDFEFGLLARFKMLYGGFRSNWSPDSERAYLARWVAGVAL